MIRPQFNPKLESLRGLAALAVCFAHSLAVYRMDQSEAITLVPIWDQSFWVACLMLTEAIFNPRNAVLLFFTLSGYVLTQSDMNGATFTGKGLKTFYIKRCFRILPMMWASLIFTLLLSQINHTAPANQATIFYGYFFEHRIDLRDFLRNFFLLDFRVSPVTWTMRVELLGSLLMPGIIYIVTRRTSRQQVLVLVLLSIVTICTKTDFQYLLCFFIGALLTRKEVAVAGRNWSIALLSGGLAMGALLQVGLTEKSYPAFTHLAMTAGAGAILWGIVADTTRFNALATGPFRLVGRLSYSLYLVHPAILGLCGVVAFAIGLYPMISAEASNVAIFLVSVIVALAVSALSFRWIEQPSIALGKSLTAKTSPSKSN